MDNILKRIILILISILLILIIVKMFDPKKNDNTDKYISWCRSDYNGHNSPSEAKQYIIECVKNYKNIEKKLK